MVGLVRLSYLPRFLPLHIYYFMYTDRQQQETNQYITIYKTNTWKNIITYLPFLIYLLNIRIFTYNTWLERKMWKFLWQWWVVGVRLMAHRGLFIYTYIIHHSQNYPKLYKNRSKVVCQLTSHFILSKL